jgi:quercetin dioxygenase-like cupin family protein
MRTTIVLAPGIAELLPGRAPRACRDESLRAMGSLDMALHVSAADTDAGVAVVGDQSFVTRAVHGVQASLMVATRPGGYHSKPHTHDCEQLNWLTAGHVWIFVEDRAYAMHPGDFLRIPANAVHWAWNRSDEPCSLVEVHAPGLQDDPSVAHISVGLFAEDESPTVSAGPRTTFLPSNNDIDQAAVERLAG